MLKDTTRCRKWGSNPGPLDSKSDAGPVRHRALPSGYECYRSCKFRDGYSLSNRHQLRPLSPDHVHLLQLLQLVESPIIIYLFILFIYTIFQEGNIFSPKASLPYGPLNIDNKYNISNMEINKQKYIQIYKQVRH